MISESREEGPRDSTCRRALFLGGGWADASRRRQHLLCPFDEGRPFVPPEAVGRGSNSCVRPRTESSPGDADSARCFAGADEVVSGHGVRLRSGSLSTVASPSISPAGSPGPRSASCLTSSA